MDIRNGHHDRLQSKRPGLLGTEKAKKPNKLVAPAGPKVTHVDMARRMPHAQPEQDTLLPAAFAPPPRKPKKPEPNIWDKDKNSLGASRVKPACKVTANEESIKAASVKLYKIPTKLRDLLKGFRYGRDLYFYALVMKLDKQQEEMALEKQYEDTCLDKIRDELPEDEPRYIVYSFMFEHGDGRVSFPLSLILCKPVGSTKKDKALYENQLNHLVEVSEIIKDRVFCIHDRCGLKEDWLKGEIRELIRQQRVAAMCEEEG